MEAAYQLNFATYNNITGMAAPLAWIPISGPPSSGNDFLGVFGSSIGVLANWQPLTFGQHAAEMTTARSYYALSLADKENTLYLHKAKVINAYLDYMASLALVGVCDENIRRVEAQLSQSRTLAANGLRPGVDTALVKSELSKIRIERLNCRKNIRLKYIQLSELLAVQDLSVPFDSTMFGQLPAFVTKEMPAVHPAIRFVNSALSLQKTQKNRLQKAWYPKLNVWATVYARGSGIDYANEVRVAEGFGLSRFNYGFGVQLTMPLMKFSELRIRLRQQDALIGAATAQIDQTELQLTKEQETADALYRVALEIADQMPEQLAAAEFAYRAMESRYAAGLVNYYDLLQTQYRLVNAQTDAKMSRYEVWKALLFQAVAAGDLNIFLSRY